MRPSSRLRPFLWGGLIVLAAVASGAAVASAQSGTPPPGVAQLSPVAPIPHVPPVDAPVVDPFRPPDQPWLPGNRGLEYGPTDGQVVRASAAGVVSFSGSVAGDQFVTIVHDPSLKTTVGYVAEVLVAVGDVVQQGQAIAIAGSTMHFTARRNGAYIDPTTLFQHYRVHIRLIE